MSEAQRIPEQRVPGKPLGRHVEHDDRSRAFAFSAARKANPLRTIHHPRYGILNQGELGSCTGNAAAGAMNTKPLHRPKTRLLTQKDAVELYAIATTLDAWPGAFPPEDTGSSGIAVAKALQQKGLITSYYWAFSVEEALSALMEAPFITGLNWYESMDVPDANGLVKVEGQIRGGHEFEVIGFQTGRNFSTSIEDSLVLCANSWGPNWGKKGRFALTVASFRQLLSEHGDVTTLHV